ncbi:hypothetical protein OG883_07060 [Streptomyces sp. NBC_01142]|uniref:hypothetical protein n=1 Tax=Streptomyces sp. NBC_01142 TaxID=2975865 RepID=UPI002255B387|nr:hypothetical protein [Streptomyces sp. NBC_01142]MCX4819668.1 hypothetical protein [Streptomyces sp. NBC_01142]
MSLATFAAHPTAVTLKDPYVLHGRQLRSGIRLEDTSRYSHDIWVLTPARLKAHEHSMILNFPTLPQRFHPSAKRLFYALLSLEAPDGEDPPGISTIRGKFTEIKRFLKWLDRRWPPERNELSELSPRDLDDYRKYLLARFPNSQAQRERSRAPLRLFWRWRRHLGEDALRFDPLHLDGWGESRPTKSRENDTARLPEDVLGPLLIWALRFIDDFAPDILEADRQWHEARADRPARNSAHTSVGARLEKLLGEYVAVGRPLPGYKGEPSLFHLAGILGCDRTSADRHRHLIDAAATVVGVTEAAFVEDVRGRLDEKPWIESITTDHTTADSLARVARHLQAACYIVIAFLSGMRDSEVKHIRRGCLEIKCDEDGRPYRWKLHSLAFKGEEDVAGVPATWTVNAAVARAVKVLEQLQPPAQRHLFGRLLHGSGSHKGTNDALGNNATNTHLNEFAAFVNRLCTNHARTDTIAAGPGQPLRLRTSHFRRTLAWFIARRPGGVIAGAIQYRHHSIQMFEGYAGTSDSGFRAEVESEQAIARGEVYMEMIEAHQHLDLAGPSAEEAARRLKDFGERAQFQGQVALDKHRLKRIMKRHDPAVYPGEYITCVNDSAKALCEKARGGNSEGLPSHGGCMPLACRNVALTAENVAAWQREIARIDKRLASRPTLAPRLRQRLQHRRAEVVEFLTDNGQEAVPA